MCQIIALTSENSKTLKKDIIKYNVELSRLLLEKGEDYFSCGIVSKNSDGKFINFVMSIPNVDNLLSRVEAILDEESFNHPEKIGMILFSRQQPEMERDIAETQPYVIKDGIIAIHGTIINDQEIAKDLEVNINVDTEVFKYLSLSEPSAEGTFSCIQIDRDIDIITRDNGLKLWRANIYESDTHIVSTGNLDYFNNIDYEISPYLSKRPILFVAFSGGMDIALSTYKELSSGMYQKAILNYFNWGSNASKEEICTLDKFRDFYSLEFDTQIEINIIDAEGYFKEFFDIAGILSKISDKGAVGNSDETEAPIAYVPYRNSQFALLLASIAEGQDLQNVHILFGLNLSEGMVYMDNSEGWLNAIEQTIKYGGKSFNITGTYELVAPYFPRTKTNMIKEFKEEFPEVISELLNLSYSCYYPQMDGSACGECGSCILREKAIDKIKS